MSGEVVPSNKPRIEGLLPEDLAKKTEDYLLSHDLTRSKLVQYAIELYIDENKIHVPLGKKDQERIKELAQENCRPVEFEAQYAIQKYINDNQGDS